MICTLLALSPGIGAVLGFVYGPSLNQALARLVIRHDVAVAAA